VVVIALRRPALGSLIDVAVVALRAVTSEVT
jgi:hypothetical protein